MKMSSSQKEDLSISEELHNIEQTAIPIERLDSFDAGNLETPFVLTNEVPKWRAFQKWDWGHFLDHYGTHTEQLNSILPGKNPRNFSLAEFIQLVEKDETADGYYFKSQFHVDTPLRQDYVVPELFNCSYGSIASDKRRYALSWIYLTGVNTYSELHQDIWYSSAWNALISGEKIWLFYPPDAIKNEHDPDPAKPDEFERHFTCQPIFCRQRPGDLVYTPSRWWHFVYNQKSGISLTENFVNQTNGDHVLAYFKDRGLKKNYATMKKIISGDLKL